MLNIRPRGNSFHVDFWKDGKRVRRSLGTSSRAAGLSLIHRLEIALSEGSRSTEWQELSAVLPRRTYLSFASLVGVTETKLYTWGDLCKSFRAENGLRIKIDTLRKVTVDRYEAVLREFEVFLKEPEYRVSLLREMDKPLLKKYRSWRVERIEKNGGKGKGIVTDLGVLHTAFQHAVEEGMIASNPVQLEKSSRGENSQAGAEPFTPGELVRMRKYAGKDTMLFLLLLHTGFRRSDAVSVTFREIDFSTNEADRVTQKKRKRVILSLASEFMPALRAELERRNAMPDDPVLLNPNTGKPFTPQSLYDHVVALGKRAGVPNAYPHRFRDTFSVALLTGGAGIYDVAQALGDTEGVVRRHYIRHIPELRRRQRSFVENGYGLDAQASFVAQEGQHDTRNGGFEAHESPKSRLTCASEISESKTAESNRVTMTKIEQPDEHRPIAIIPSTHTEVGKNSLGDNTDSATKREMRAMIHGTRTAYDRDGCRCERCRAAASERMKKYRARLKAEGREPMVTLTCPECGKEFLRPKRNSPAAKGTKNAYCSRTCSWKAAAKRGGGLLAHGTRTAYDQHGCRCELCKAVHSEHMKKYRAARAKPKTAVVMLGANGVHDQPESCQGADYEGHVPAQSVERRTIHEHGA